MNQLKLKTTETLRKLKTNPNNIVIVGGGSSGWMTAAILCTRFPNKHITLIESLDIPTVGVGESTLGSINLFFNLLGLEDKDWMPYCNATYKLAIQFTDFYKKGETFYYPFGDKDFSNSRGIDDWMIKKAYNKDLPIKDYYDTFYSIMPFVYDNKIPATKVGNFNFTKDAAYHMDAAAFGEFLKEKVCIPKGVNYIQDTIQDFELHDDNIHCLKCNNHTIHGDLFVDCSGFRSLLLEQTMKVPFTSFKDQLPNDRAWTCHLPYDDKDAEIENVTNCTAYNNGWIWNIPLYHRAGSGYVFCTDFISEDDALIEYKQYIQQLGKNPNELNFRLVKIKNGRHDVCWKNNVVGVGLAYGFIEPLESTGLLSTQEMLLALCETLYNDNVGSLQVKNFNYFCANMLDTFKEFVAYHYIASSRKDTKYWKHVTENISIDSDESIDLAHNYTVNHTTSNDSAGLPDILVGMHYYSHNPLSVDWTSFVTGSPLVTSKNWENTVSQKNRLYQSISDKSLSHYNYLERFIY